MQNESKLRKDFWDTINNPKKVNLNLLTDDDIATYTIGERKDVIMVIYVPMAKREQKPIYINNDIFNGTFRRNYEGDYHCTRLQVKAMLRDQTERTMDMEILDKVPMEDLNYDTIHGYRNSHRTLKEGHPFERLNDHEEDIIRDPYVLEFLGLSPNDDFYESDLEQALITHLQKFLLELG